MSQPYNTDGDPVVRTSALHIAGCLMQIQTTQSGAVLLNGDLVQAFQAAPTVPATLPTHTTSPPPKASEGDDTGFPDIPF